ncbi:MAG: SusD/RagB family nutrient-binding outer membrane lipoprotein, partial [Muribaculaceae bacterium]|nr:SusD/RagB family nutrient-binding outer membrane lipoprotein [Muribaculaceae bacterium]
VEALIYNSAKYSSRDTWYWNDEIVQITACTGQKMREEHRYKFTSTEWQTAWNRFSGYANNADHMYELADQEGDNATKAVALTMKVMNMADLTDMFGDIPYREAFLARKGGTRTPVFDSQQDVYQQMLAELEQANLLYAGNPTFLNPGLDGIYNGNMAQWRKFNNSLMLRLLCRVSGRKEMKAGEKMKEMLANPDLYPIISSNSDNATVTFSGIYPYASYFYQTQEDAFTMYSYKLSEQLIKMMAVTNGSEQAYIDPRLPIIGRQNGTNSNPDHIWLGAVSGGTTSECDLSNPGASYLNYYVLAQTTSPVTFIDYAEIRFILAEMAFKGYIDGGEQEARQYYEQAVRASCEYWELMRSNVTSWGSVQEPASIDDTRINGLLTSELASWDLAEDKAELIGNQKFLALFWHGFQAYHEIRRTGYPVLKIGAGTHYNNYKFPSRFAYPNNTVGTNTANVQAALIRMKGENDMHTPVWWSKDAISRDK